MNRTTIVSVAAIALVGITLSAKMAYASPSGDGSGVPQQLSQLQQRVATLETTVANQASQINDMKQSFTAMTTTQQGIEQEQRNIEQELRGMETTQSGIESTERGIEAEQRGIEQKMSDLNQQLSALQSQVTALQGGSGVGQSTGYSVCGTLTDVNGRPFINSMQLVDSNGKTYYVGFDSLGHFVFRNVPNGSYSVRINMPGLDLAQPVSATVSGADISNLQVKCAEAVYAISGVAKSGGQPLANQTVMIHCSAGYWGGYWGNTDQTGNFSIDGLPNGTYTILIGADPHNPDATALASGTVTISGADVTGLTMGN